MVFHAFGKDFQLNYFERFPFFFFVYFYSHFIVKIEKKNYLPKASLRWLDTVFLKNGNLRFRSVFLENYYLFEDKGYFCYVKQHLKSSNSFTKVAQLPLLWQQ